MILGRIASALALRHPCDRLAGAPQVDLTGSAAVGTAALRELRPFALRELRLARIWNYKVGPPSVSQVLELRCIIPLLMTP